jgi:hypothetical protein
MAKTNTIAEAAGSIPVRSEPHPSDQPRQPGVGEDAGRLDPPNGKESHSLPGREPAASSPTHAALAIIERAARDPAVDVEKLERLLAMQERLFARDAEQEFNEAKARIKQKLARIKIVKRKWVRYDIEKNNKNAGQYDAFKYAPLEDIDEILAPLLADEQMDLSYTTRPRTVDGGGAVIVGKLKHIRGHAEESEMALALDISGGKSNIQGMGSTTSYGRRYVACNIFNIVVIGDDDDGTGGFVDEAQVAHIRALIADLQKIDPKRDEAAFRKFMKVPSLEEIPFRLYRKATSALEERLSKEPTR